MDKHGIAAYDENGHTGLVRHVVTRVGGATGEVMVCVVINGEDLPYKAILASELQRVENMASVLLNVNNRRTNLVLGGRVETLYGKGHIADCVGPVKLNVSLKSFLQVNTAQTEALYKAAAEFAMLSPRDKVIDAYCGIGSISLYIAGKVKGAWGVEIDPVAIADARANALLNGIDNAEFICGAAEDELDRLAAEVRPDVIILDPPRKGCGKGVLSAAARSGASRIVYISCDPATLSRDIKSLAGEGFAAVKVQPVDMFAQTPHVECVCLLQKAHKA